MPQPQPENTLPDFIGTLRSHRVLFMLVVVAAIASSIVYSLNQESTYTASASLSFLDQSRDLGLVGVGPVSVQTPEQLASANAQTIVEPRVASRVKRSLGLKAPASEVSDRITASVRENSSLVELSATGPTAGDAQRLANAFTRAGVREANRDARRAFGEAARNLEREKPPKDDVSARAIYDQQQARLRALSAIARPARIAKLAPKPAGPTSPRPVRNAILGGALGLVLALLAVFLRDSLDRRLRSATEIQPEFAMPLLGYVGERVLGRSAKPGGDARVTAPDWEMFRILRRNLDFLGDGPTRRLVAVTSSLPEEGKTTVASFLAFASAAAGQRTLLIECDVRRPVLAERLGIQSAPGLTDFVTGDADPEDILQTVSFGDLVGNNGYGPSHDAEGKATHQHEVVCIAAGTPPDDPVEIFRSERFRAMLANVKEVYDLVVLDTTPLLVVVDVLELLPEVEAILVCAREDRTTHHQARAGKAALDRLPERPSGLVVTGTRSGAGEYGYYGYYG